jgi:hypothetical protein
MALMPKQTRYKMDEFSKRKAVRHYQQMAKVAELEMAVAEEDRLRTQILGCRRVLDVALQAIDAVESDMARSLAIKAAQRLVDEL